MAPLPRPLLNLRTAEAAVAALSSRLWTWPGEQSSTIQIRPQVGSEFTPIPKVTCLFRDCSVKGSFSPGPSASVAASRRSSPGESGLHEDPTLPVQRKLAWNEEEGLGERDESEISQEELTVEKNEGNPIDEHGSIKERNERYVLSVSLKCHLVSEIREAVNCRSDIMVSVLGKARMEDLASVLFRSWNLNQVDLEF